jgi:hypothetical protein
MKFIDSNSLNIKASEKLINQIELSTQNYSIPESFNYNALILNLKFLNIILNSKTKKPSEQEISKISQIFENSISQITSFKLSTKIIHKEIQDDEILSLSELITSTFQSTESNEKSKESLQKLFALYFDNKEFLPFIYQKYVTNSSNANSHNLNNNLTDSLNILKANLEAYLCNFGFLPNGFGEAQVTEYYCKCIRPSLTQAASLKNLSGFAEAEFAYFLLKSNYLKELQADLISLLDASKTKGSLVKTFYADFILSNSLIQKNFYYENLEKIYNTNLNIQQEKEFANQLLFQTIAYMKDGNKEYAVSNLLKSLEKRAEFVNNNDSELVKLISGLSDPQSLNAGENGEFVKDISIRLDADFIPFIEQIKQNIRDLLAYECAFKTQRNVLLAKENVIDNFFDRKSANVNFYQNASDFNNVNSNNNKNSNLDIAEKNYYSEKFNKIIYNMNQIKNLCEKKESEYLTALKSIKSANNQNKSLSNLLQSSNSNNNKNLQHQVNTHLEEMKVYIYSRFEQLDKFYSEISKIFRMNFNRIEDFENLKFESSEAKQNFLRNLERKIREMSSFKTLYPDMKELLNFYNSFYVYAENKPISLGSEVILSEDMLNYLENPDFLLKREFNEDQYIAKARGYFRDYYAKAQKRFPRQSFFVLENLDFLKTNLKIDFENFKLKSLFKNADKNNEACDIGNDLNLLKSKIEFYQKNLKFVKQILAKIPDFDVQSGLNTAYINNKNDLLLKKLILFEVENSANTSNAIVSAENKPNHLIEAYLKCFTGRVSKRLLSNLNTKQSPKKKRDYPFKALNDRNYFKFLFTQHSGNSLAANVLSSIAEKVIVPAISSKKIGVFKNVLAQLQSLEQAVKGSNFDEDSAINGIYCELLKKMNISFNKGSGQIAEAQKLQEMKNMIDQNFEIFDVKHCVYMIQFGVENNIAEGNF